MPNTFLDSFWARAYEPLHDANALADLRDKERPWDERKSGFAKAMGFDAVDDSWVLVDVFNALDSKVDSEREDLLGSDDLSTFVYDEARKATAEFTSEDTRVFVGMSDNASNYGYYYTGDDTTVMWTGGFAGCYCVVLLGPGHARTLAHISSMHYGPATWDNLTDFRDIASQAETTHVYHLGISDPREQAAFLDYFGLRHDAVIHPDRPATVEVRPDHSIVTG